MSDPRTERLATVLVQYSTALRPGDRVLIEAETAAEPLVRALFARALQAGAHPHLALSLTGQDTYTGIDDVFLREASDEQLDYPASFHEIAYREFESRIRIYSSSNTRHLMRADTARMARRQRAVQPLLRSQMERGGRGEFRWVTTLFPTIGHAHDADMSLAEFEDYVFAACHVDGQDDPVAFWKAAEKRQDRWAEALNGHDRVEIRSPDCDLRLSIRDRQFISSCGTHNMPDGEIFTGPVETSAEGWVRFAFPLVYKGREVEGVELTFREGKAQTWKATRNSDFLETMLHTDEGARYLGEFGIGTNAALRLPTRNILLDEKMGGTIHLALGAGYPDTGSHNLSAIHWDMLVEMRRDSEIRVDGEVVYQNGEFRI
ncbi:MAG TPA: aminopeptidase [Anaerolineales bacterium]|nr:aminopeptidase [Anaerolineales bacterium]